MTTHTLSISPTGELSAIYSDDLRGLMGTLGTLSIRRASHVEPDASGLWWADMSPMNGPLIGPFHFRWQALQAEREWLEVRL